MLFCKKLFTFADNYIRIRTKREIKEFLLKYLLNLSVSYKFEWEFSRFYAQDFISGENLVIELQLFKKGGHGLIQIGPLPFIFCSGPCV